MVSCLLSMCCWLARAAAAGVKGKEASTTFIPVRARPFNTTLQHNIPFSTRIPPLHVRLSPHSHVQVRAMQIIDELEVNRRGPYGGGIGHVSFTGRYIQWWQW